MSRFALIDKTIVKNVIESNSYEADKARENLNYDAPPVLVDSIPVQPGDTFDGAFFFRNGAKIERTKSASEVCQELGIEATDTLLENLSLGKYATDLELRIITFEESNV